MKRTKFKMVALLTCALVLIFSLCACSNSSNSSTKISTTETETEVETDTTSDAMSSNEVVKILNDSFEGEGTWFYDDESKAYLYTGELFASWVDVYTMYGNDGEVITLWEDTEETMITLAEAADIATGTSNVYGILNPYNNDNILLLVNSSGVIYSVTDNTTELES